MSNKERVKSIDMAKGVGILLVIFGHSVPESNIVAWQSTFFMPLFFVCSGLCYHNSKTIKFTAQKILLPYYIWGGLGLLFEMVLGLLKREITIALIFRQVVKLILGQSMWNYPLWFLVAFFVCKVCFDYIMRVSKKYEKNKNLFFVAVMIACFIIGLVLANIRNMYSFFYPYRFDIGIMMIPFMLAGYLLQNSMKIIQSKKMWKQITLLGLCFGVNIFAFVNNSFLSVNSSDYGNPILFVIGALCGSLFVIISCEIFSRLRIAESALSWYGRNSMLIMCIHAIILMFIAKGLILVKTYTGIDWLNLDVIEFICCAIIMIPMVNVIERIKNKFLPDLKIKRNYLI